MPAQGRTMTFVDFIASRPVEGDPDRRNLIEDARAVVKLGGRQEFLDRLYIHSDSPAVRALREEWEKTR